MRETRKNRAKGFGAVLAGCLMGCGSETPLSVEAIEGPGMQRQHAGGGVKGLIAAEQDKLVADDGAAGDHFGNAVAVSGNTAIVGLPGKKIGTHAEQGAAYIFVRNGATWSKQATLVVSGGVAGEQFGTSVAIDGDTAVVASAFSKLLKTLQGSVYIFIHEGSVWNLQQELSLPILAGSGPAIALSGDTLVIGDERNVTYGTDSGAVYVFERNDSKWTHKNFIFPTDAAAGAKFGHSVSISGDTILVGTTSSAAYAYVRSPNGWSQQQKLTAGGQLSTNFGAAVSLSGDMALVGAPDPTLVLTPGSAFVFQRSGGSWSKKKQFMGDPPAGDINFGHSVAISSDLAIVGVNAAKVGGHNKQGAAYVFSRSGTLWKQEARLSPGDGAAGDEFGTSVSLSGDTAIVGSLKDDDKGSESGSAYAFIIRKALGDACDSASDCMSEHCQDNVCCDKECSDPCFTCSAAKKGIGENGICEPVMDATACDDGSACTSPDSCQNGVCSGIMSVVCPEAPVCQLSTCNPSTGLCDSSSLPDQTPCPGGVCKAGGCYDKDSSSSTGSGGMGGMGGEPMLPASGAAGNASSSGNGGAGGSSPNNVNQRDIFMRGGGCHCRAIAEINDTSSGRFAGLYALFLTTLRRRKRDRTLNT